jgi:hypothetical protein
MGRAVTWLRQYATSWGLSLDEVIRFFPVYLILPEAENNQTVPISILVPFIQSMGLLGGYVRN